MALDSLIEKKSPFDAVRFPSLSRTMTSKRHNGEVGVSRLGQVWGKPVGGGVVGRYRPRMISSFGLGAGGFCPIQIMDSSTGSIVSTVPWMENGEPTRALVLWSV